MLDNQSVDALPEGELDSTLAASRMQDIHHRLPTTDGAVHPRHRLVATEDHLVIELDSEIAEPLDCRTGPLCQTFDDG